MLETIFSLTFLLQIIRISVPYTYAALGGTISERGGIVNIALEGIMLSGAFGAVVGAYFSHSALVGLLCGIALGVAMSLLHGLMTIRFKADHIVSGVAINLLALGATKFFLKMIFQSASNSPAITVIKPLIEPTGRTEALTRVFTHPLVLLAAAMIGLCYFILFKTRFGLRLRACGEHPQAAQSVGINVPKMRYAGLILSGVFTSLGGIWLAFDQQQFTDNMINGRGYIALAAMIFGKWMPFPAAGACLLFGAAEALQIALQSSGKGLPTQFIQMLPYLLTLITIIGFIKQKKELEPA